MRTFLFIRRIVILTSLALIFGLPVLSTQAADYLPGAGVPEFMGVQPDDIMNALGSYFKANDPTSDFTFYLKRLTLVRDAENRGSANCGG